MFTEEIQSENQEVFLPLLKDKKTRLFVKREDLIHPFVSGNKFRKLKYNIAEAKRQNKQTLLTFGGAFSNHIVATAIAGHMSGFKTIGIIRGEELADKIEKVLKENETLKEAKRHGMDFVFVSREDYRQKETIEFIDKLKEKYGDFYLIPEGGTNQLAIRGCTEIIGKNEEKFNYICVAVGTGGTISGLINSEANKHQKIIGFPALKGSFLSEEIKKNTKENADWHLNEEYSFGGYGKYNTELIRFINVFKSETAILLDPIYTGKMMYGILDLVKKDYFEENSIILAIHTGGIQGIKGINKKLEKKNLELIEI